MAARRRPARPPPVAPPSPGLGRPSLPHPLSPGPTRPGARFDRSAGTAHRRAACPGLPGPARVRRGAARGAAPVTPGAPTPGRQDTDIRPSPSMRTHGVATGSRAAHFAAKCPALATNSGGRSTARELCKHGASTATAASPR